MRRPLKLLLQCIVVVVVVAAGAWVRGLCLNDPMPVAEEAPHAMTAAAAAEFWGTAGCPRKTVARRSPFHEATALCARFVGERRTNLRLRCYRVLPLIAGVLLLPLMLGLGLRRRGGMFYTADGPLWAMALAALSPVLVWHAWRVEPFGALALLFLAMLTAARSYAQWPGYVPSALIGVLWALAAAIHPDALWVLAAVVPGVAMGVGWTRLCLYWRTLHLALAIAVGVGVWSLLRHLGLTGVPTMPALPEALSAWVAGVSQRVVWLCGWGVGLVAWVGLSIWGFCGSDRRWSRTLSVVFFFSFIGSLFFPRGGAFAVPLAVLTPVMAGVALSAVARPWVRWTLGNALAMVSCAALAVTVAAEVAAKPGRAEQKMAVETLSAAATAPRGHSSRIRILSEEPQTCAQLLWPLRAETGGGVVLGDQPLADADILMVEESRLGSVPPHLGQWIRPGRACVADGRCFRVFAEVPKEMEGPR